MTDQLPAIFQEPGQLANVFQSHDLAANSDLSEGVGQGYGVLSIKGSKWRIKFKGEEYPIVDPETGDPKPSLEAVLVKANPHLTKQYYEAKYEDGSTAAPDCYSLDGKKPAPEVQTPQHTNCATCPKNQFGSRISDNGKKAKACSDTRRVAVVPLSDLRNDSFGGPMLLRVPPSALRGLAEFSSLLQKRGYPYYSVAVRIGFDMDASHPLPTFKPIRPLTEEEAETVLELQGDDVTERVLADFSVDEAPEKEAAAETDEIFEQPQTPNVAAPPAAKPAAPAPKPVTAMKPAAPVAKPAAPAVTPTTKPVAAVKPAAPKPAVVRPAAPVAKPAAKPAQQEAANDSDLDADIASIIAGLETAAAE